MDESSGVAGIERSRCPNMLPSGDEFAMDSQKFEEAFMMLRNEPNNHGLYQPFMIHFVVKPFSGSETEMAFLRFLLEVAKGTSDVTVFASVCKCLSTIIICPGTKKEVKLECGRLVVLTFCEFLNTDKVEILAHVLNVIAALTAKSGELASSIFEYVNLDLLVSATLGSEIVTIQRSGMAIFANYIHAECVAQRCPNQEFVDVYLRLCTEVFTKGNALSQLVGLRALRDLAANWMVLHQPVVESGMVRFLNTFLNGSDDDLFVAAADVFEQLLNSDCGIANDIDLDVALQNMTNEKLSVASTSLVGKYVNRFHESVIVLAELGLIEQTFAVLTNGTHQAKINSLCILTRLVGVNSPEGLSLRVRCTNPEIAVALVELMAYVPPVLVRLIVPVIQIFIAVDRASGNRMGIITSLNDENVHKILLDCAEQSNGEMIEALLSQLS